MLLSLKSGPFQVEDIFPDMVLGYGYQNHQTLEQLMYIVHTLFCMFIITLIVMNIWPICGLLQISCMGNTDTQTHIHTYTHTHIYKLTKGGGEIKLLQSK